MTKNAIIALLALLWLPVQAVQAQTPVSVTPNSWATCAPMPTARAGAFSASSGDQLLRAMIGGVTTQSNVFITVQ
jgi:hypothetical protein